VLHSYPEGFYPRAGHLLRLLTRDIKRALQGFACFIGLHEHRNLGYMTYRDLVYRVRRCRHCRQMSLDFWGFDAWFRSRGVEFSIMHHADDDIRARFRKNL
jgi:hypothetical protein